MKEFELRFPKISKAENTQAATKRAVEIEGLPHFKIQKLESSMEIVSQGGSVGMDPSTSCKLQHV